MHWSWTCLAATLVVGSGFPASAAPLTAATIEAATFTPLPDAPGRVAVAEVVKAEVLLARAGVSPGSIDGIDGDNFRKALRAFQKKVGLPDRGRLDQATWDRLAGDKAPVLRRYSISAQDVRGPFTRRIPTRFELQSGLERLGYRDIREALAERFHLSQRLFAALNPKATLGQKSDIDVPAADLPVPIGALGAIVVDKSDKSVEAFDPSGQLLAVYPASIGSGEKPAPSGRFEIRRVVRHPDYTYQPKYGFKGVKAKTPFRIAPGPNNPVGNVWMDLSFEGYGIHGTPEPEQIGKTQSHGCIRMTNWDAEHLADMAKPGTPVFFQDGADDPLPKVEPSVGSFPGSPSPASQPPRPEKAGPADAASQPKS